MRVGVLGGGLQGCCVAIELANRGVEVTVFDKNDVLLSRAAIANEGKIHLGYMYVGDPTLSTAKTMLAGALSFAPFLERHIALSPHSFSTSLPTTYVVHRDSQHSVEEVFAYLEIVHSMVNTAAEGKKGAYFGMDLLSPLQTLSAAKKEAKFNPAIALAAVSTPEVAINPTALALTLRKYIDDHPKIEVRCNCTVISAEKKTDSISVRVEDRGSTQYDSFDHVVNALWDGRFALNEALGYQSNRPWLHRLKYGVSFRLPSGA